MIVPTHYIAFSEPGEGEIPLGVMTGRNPHLKPNSGEVHDRLAGYAEWFARIKSYLASYVLAEELERLRGGSDQAISQRSLDNTARAFNDVRESRLAIHAGVFGLPFRARLMSNREESLPTVVTTAFDHRELNMQSFKLKSPDDLPVIEGVVTGFDLQAPDMTERFPDISPEDALKFLGVIVQQSRPRVSIEHGIFPPRTQVILPYASVQEESLHRHPSSYHPLNVRGHNLFMGPGRPYGFEAERKRNNGAGLPEGKRPSPFRWAVRLYAQRLESVSESPNMPNNTPEQAENDPNAEEGI